VKKVGGNDQVAGGSLGYDGLFLRCSLENNPVNRTILKRIQLWDIVLLPVMALGALATVLLITYGAWNLTNSDKPFLKQTTDLTTVDKSNPPPNQEKQR